MACAMTKQSLGIYSANFSIRYDTRGYIMYYPQEPLVQTRTYKASTSREARRARTAWSHS